LQRIDAGIRVLIVTACDTDPYPAQAMKAGAAGTSPGARPLRIWSTRYGGGYFSGTHVRRRRTASCMRSFDTVPECPFDQLNREMQITLMVVSCGRVQQISRDLHLSPKTVNSYRYRIQLNVTSDVELALLAVRTA
jgi:DNA-binding NarL/FixJ family response regulator